MARPKALAAREWPPTPEDFRIPETVDPWDVIELLDWYASRGDFGKRWRAFQRDCALILLPRLPLEASLWVVVADMFDAGRLEETDLTAARVRAWQYIDARRATWPTTEVSGLSVAMTRLWPSGSATSWYVEADAFLTGCEEAGLPDEEWWPLLLTRFREILEE